MHLSVLRATTPLYAISTNDPRPNWDVSARLILAYFESGSFRTENKRRISKFPVALGRSVQSYVYKNSSKKRRSPSFVHKVDNSTRAINRQVSYSGEDKRGVFCIFILSLEILALLYIPRQGPAVKNRTEQGSVCGHAFHRNIYGKIQNDRFNRCRQARILFN